MRNPRTRIWAKRSALSTLKNTFRRKPRPAPKRWSITSIAALRSDIPTLSWMSPETKKEALAKLEAFDVKIGYPDKWRDYSKLSIERGSYAANTRRSVEFEQARQLAKIGQPVDRSEWGMTPPTVNAYNSSAA